MNEEARMKDLRLTLYSALRGVNIEEEADLYGYTIRDATKDWKNENPILYRAYVSEEGYSAYYVQPNWYDEQDEYILAEKVPLNTCVNAILNRLKRIHPELWPTEMPPNSKTWYSDYMRSKHGCK